MFSVRCFAVVAFLGFLPISANAQERPPKSEALAFVEQIVPLFDLLKKLDKFTTIRGPVVGGSVGSPTLQDLLLVAPFKQRYRLSSSVTNKAFGREIPGRNLSVTIEVDCRVQVAMALKDIRIQPDPEYPDTILVELPEFKVSADIAEEANEFLEVIHGFSRPQDPDKVKELRAQLLEQAKGLARNEFEANRLASWRTEIADELKSVLRAKFPKQRVYVK